MSRTYGGEQPLERCLALISYTATPMFLVGIVQFYPVIWLNYVVGLPVLAYTVYRLYIGTPIMMRIPGEQGFFLQCDSSCRYGRPDWTAGEHRDALERRYST